MHTTVSILTAVDLSRGSAGIPEVKGVYRSNAVARDNAIVLLCGKAAEWDIDEAKVDAKLLRISDGKGERAVQMNISEAELSIEATFEVI